MYQGGCGELSLWGENYISEDFECKIWNGKEREIFVGRCSSEGHCVRESQAISLYNPNCIVLNIRDNITSQRTFQGTHQIFHNSVLKRQLSIFQMLEGSFNYNEIFTSNERLRRRRRKSQTF